MVLSETAHRYRTAVTKTETDWRAPAIIPLHHILADFSAKSAIFRALGRSWALPQARRWGGSAAKWQSC